MTSDETRAAGPYDAEALPEDDVERIDLGSLLIAPFIGRDLRVAFDEQTGEVRGVQLAGEDAEVDLRAFAAPRNGDLWSEILPQIAAETTRLGGNVTEQEGRFGTELLCEVVNQQADGTAARQTARVVGINGSRWFLRATFTGAAAVAPEAIEAWDEALAQTAVRRGAQALPVGEPLELKLPEGLQQVES
ncbi:DUF3710 domain-containing protein [Nocardioides montaniterrae]